LVAWHSFPLPNTTYFVSSPFRDRALGSESPHTTPSRRDMKPDWESHSPAKGQSSFWHSPSTLIRPFLPQGRCGASCVRARVQPARTCSSSIPGLQPRLGSENLPRTSLLLKPPGLTFLLTPGSLAGSKSPVLRVPPSSQMPSPLLLLCDLSLLLSTGPQPQSLPSYRQIHLLCPLLALPTLAFWGYLNGSL
jgi:hypothetical protein